MKTMQKFATAVLALSLLLLSTIAAAQKIKVAGIYTQPLQQKWDARLHQASQSAAMEC